MILNYTQKEDLMKMIFDKWKTPTGFNSRYKGVPMDNYEGIKSFIDFTKYYVVFRGPRYRGDVSTRKCNAKAFDVYQRKVHDMVERRIECEAFQRGVNWKKGSV